MGRNLSVVSSPPHAGFTVVLGPEKKDGSRDPTACLIGQHGSRRHAWTLSRGVSSGGSWELFEQTATSLHLTAECPLLTPASDPHQGVCRASCRWVSCPAGRQPSWTSAGSTWDAPKFYLCRPLSENVRWPSMPALGLLPVLLLVQLTSMYNSKFNKEILSPGVKTTASATHM